MSLAFRRSTIARFALAPLAPICSLSHAQIFADDFNAGASPLWSNERGDWSASDGVYNAANPTNNPPTRTLLPFVLRDLSLDVDVNGVRDGGVWVHYDPATENGVLLVTGGFSQQGDGLYWHIVRNGSYSGNLGHVPGLFARGADIHLRIIVRGDRYMAFLNGACTAATTLVTDEFPTGRVGLYDYFSTQTFDNVLLDAAPPVIADFNGDGGVDGADVEAFFAAWENGLPESDVNADGGIDGADVEAFFTAWENGCD